MATRSKVQRGGRKVNTSRAAWIDAFGPIPDGLHVRHSCHDPECTNLDHLSLGTHRDNMQDMVKAGRHASQKKTHCPKGHPYDDMNTYVQKNGWRRCRRCKADYQQRWRSR